MTCVVTGKLQKHKIDGKNTNFSLQKHYISKTQNLRKTSKELRNTQENYVFPLSYAMWRQINAIDRLIHWPQRLGENCVLTTIQIGFTTTLQFALLH